MINQVTLVGRIGKELTLRYTPNGVASLSFSLAVTRPFSNQSGERETDWINVQVWRKQAENTANFCDKGSLVGVTGRIQTRNYDGNDGKKVYVTEVIAENVAFLDSKRNNTQSNTNTQGSNKNSGNGQEWANNNHLNINDDDISDSLPF